MGSPFHIISFLCRSSNGGGLMDASCKSTRTVSGQTEHGFRAHIGWKPALLVGEVMGSCQCNDLTGPFGWGRVSTMLFMDLGWQCISTLGLVNSGSAEQWRAS